MHVLYPAFQSNNYSKRDRSHKLEMYPVWPSRGLLLADYDFALRKKSYLIREGIAYVYVGGNLPKAIHEGVFDQGNFFRYALLSLVKHFRII